MSETIADRSHSDTTHRRKSVGAGIAASSLFLVWFLASVLVHALPHGISDRAGAPLLPGSEITPSISNTFYRSCINCHFEKTSWPWYSHVAPISWLIETDVKRAREHLNLSRWDSLDTAEQRLLLTAIATVIENREMPPHRYLLLHPEAKLSADESVQVIEWTHAERRRLRASFRRTVIAGNISQSAEVFRTEADRNRSKNREQSYLSQSPR